MYNFSIKIDSIEHPWVAVSWRFKEKERAINSGSFKWNLITNMSATGVSADNLDTFVRELKAAEIKKENDRQFNEDYIRTLNSKVGHWIKVV